MHITNGKIRLCIEFDINIDNELNMIMKKTCCTCKIEKSSSEFRKDKTRVDGVQSYCKICARAYHKTAHMERYAGQVKEKQTNRRLEGARHLLEYKSGVCCMKCGENTSCCLEFHHVDPTTKKFDIGGNTTRSWSLVLKELEKCVCLCSNCHKKLHAGLLTI